MLCKTFSFNPQSALPQNLFVFSCDIDIDFDDSNSEDWEERAFKALVPTDQDPLDQDDLSDAADGNNLPRWSNICPFAMSLTLFRRSDQKVLQLMDRDDAPNGDKCRGDICLTRVRNCLEFQGSAQHTTREDSELFKECG